MMKRRSLKETNYKLIYHTKFSKNNCVINLLPITYNFLDIIQNFLHELVLTIATNIFLLLTVALPNN